MSDNPPRINEINTHSRMLLKEYTDLPKEELKKVFEKNKNSALAQEIEKYWKYADRLQPFQKNKFIESPFGTEMFFVGFYKTVSRKPTH
jgi:hypothetical protein